VYAVGRKQSIWCIGARRINYVSFKIDLYLELIKFEIKVYLYVCLNLQYVFWGWSYFVLIISFVSYEPIEQYRKGTMADVLRLN